MNQRILLAQGILNWCKSERLEDRYGSVTIQTAGGLFDGTLAAPDAGYADFAGAPVGVRGRLLAEVLETRQSPHIGDVFRNIFPVTPKVGEVIVLGAGTLFRDAPHSTYQGDGPAVGVRPVDPKFPWLNVRALYRAHEQTVRLWFEPAD